jgi:pyruvate kinase
MLPIQIVATIGPNCNDQDTINQMVASGMSVARLNFSWGTHEDHRQYVEKVRAASKENGVKVSILQDLSGPRVQDGAAHGFNGDISVITEKDRADIKAIADKKVEYVALSFLKDANDVKELRAILNSEGLEDTKIVAKIERQEALDNLDEIIAEVDGIMVARGDLGDAVPFETLPYVSKDILKRCNQAGKPAIVATEMLISMLNSVVPSRADVSDIANAVLDGASATMVSNETAVGKNPVEVIKVMRKVVDEAIKHTQVETSRF